MNALKSVGRGGVAVLVGGLVAFVGFGLLLGLAWLPRLRVYPAYREVTLCLTAGLAIVAGGYLCGWLADRHPARHGLALGLLVGLIGCGYILGPHWTLILLVPAAGALGALGGWLAARSPSGLGALGEAGS